MATKNLEELNCNLTLLHSERPKLYAILAFLSAKGLRLTIIISGSGTITTLVWVGNWYDSSAPC